MQFEFVVLVEFVSFRRIVCQRQLLIEPSLSFSFRSNPGTPTQVRRPDFIYVANQQQQQPGMNYYDFPIHQQQPNQMMVHQQQTQSGLPPYPNGSPQRRFLSEGELLSRTTSNGLSIGNELSYVNRNTVDNIRELAGSPQRGVYNWKDNSPPGYNNNQAQMPMATAMYGVAPGQQQQQQQQLNNSNNFIGRPPLPTSQQQYLQNQNMTVVTSAQQQQQPNVRQSNVNAIINNIVANSANTSNYHPALRGGVQVFPPQVPASPQVKRKQTPTRPISFVRALEMANSIEMTNTNYQPGQQQQGDQSDANKPGGGEANPSIQQTQQIADRGSIYDTNYEISVWSGQTAGNAGSERFKMMRKESVDKYWNKQPGYDENWFVSVSPSLSLFWLNRDFLTRTETDVTFRKRSGPSTPPKTFRSNYNRVIQQNFFVQFPLLLILLKGCHYDVLSRDYWRKGCRDEPMAIQRTRIVSE